MLRYEQITGSEGRVMVKPLGPPPSG